MHEFILLNTIAGAFDTWMIQLMMLMNIIYIYINMNVLINCKCIYVRNFVIRAPVLVTPVHLRMIQQIMLKYADIIKKYKMQPYLS